MAGKKKSKILDPQGEPIEVELTEAEKSLAVRAMDLAESDAIIAELTAGHQAEAYVYEFESGGRTHRGVSRAGALALYFKLHDRAPQAEELVVSNRPDPDNAKGIIHTVAARHRDSKGAVQWGVCEEPEYRKSKGGVGDWNKHALATAKSKADRNAILNLFDPQQVQKFMLDCLAQRGRVKRLTAKDAEGKAAENPQLTALRQRLFAIIGKSFDISKEKPGNREKAIKFIEDGIGKSLSSVTTVEEMRAVGDNLEKQRQRNPDDFAAAIADTEVKEE